MRNALIYVFLAVALIGVGIAVYALLQPNPSGDYLTGMAHLFISAMGAALAIFAAVLSALLSFTHLKTWWIMTGAAAIVGSLWAALALL